MSLLDICITIIAFLIGFNLKKIIGGFSKKEAKILNKLFFYHMAIAVVFNFYIASNGGDAIHYWEAVKTESFTNIWNLVLSGSATGVMYFINYFPSNFLELSFFTGNMMYAVLGFAGFVYLFKITKQLFGDFSEFENAKIFKIPIFPLIWFLPNFHFWSSGIGKDSILFFCIALFIYCLLNLRRRWFGMLVSVLLSAAIRPHILLFLIVSFGIGFVLDGRLKGYQKVLIGGLFIFGFAVMFNYVLQFIQLESLEASSIESYTSSKSSSLNTGGSGSGVDISGYPFPLKLFTFLYRPLFFDIKGVLAIVASFENLFLLMFSFWILSKKPYQAIKKAGFLIKGMIIYFLIGAMAFSLILGNLGIMLRQKNAFIPYLVIFGLWTLYLKRKEAKSTATPILDQ